MTKIQQIILLTLLGITDAYMISHPNLLGKIGVRIYNYDMIKTFPAAVGTVLGTLGFSLVLSYFLQNQKAKKWAKYLLILLLIMGIVVFLNVFFKFSSGSYVHTGKVFKYGMILLPILLIYIFVDGLWIWIKNSKSQ
jgi:uncharacterized membrane protein